tara:strand:- start:133963 stop:134160 length:198 start_codon:yes stop_codon:yes gene_type:complete
MISKRIISPLMIQASKNSLVNSDSMKLPFSTKGLPSPLSILNDIIWPVVIDRFFTRGKASQTIEK